LADADNNVAASDAMRPTSGDQSLFRRSNSSRCQRWQTRRECAWRGL